MKIIGLTGSIAMGKSEVAQILKSAGVPVFDADAEVHRLYETKTGADLVANIVPEAVVDQKVDRNILSYRVLADPALLATLERDVHGEIKKRRNAFIAEEQQKGTRLIALDIPLLFETGAENQVDVTVVVSSHPDMQKTRAMARPGMTDEKLERIINRQMPDQEKRKRADYIIENNGSREDLKNEVLQFLQKLEQKNVG